MCCTQWLSAARAATELDAAHEEKQLRACGTAKDPKATVVEHEMILLRYAQFRIIHPSFRVTIHRPLWICSVLQFHLIVFHPYRPLRSFLSQYQVLRLSHK